MLWTTREASAIDQEASGGVSRVNALSRMSGLLIIRLKP
jgi:hypothetical protein